MAIRPLCAPRRIVATNGRQSPWIVCQLGAREHYAVARALHGAGRLEMLVTDAWVPPRHPLAWLGGGLSERFHADIPQAKVAAANPGIVAFETSRRLAGTRGWPLIAARNAWFQAMARARLARLPDDGRPRTVFAYSYAAKEIFKLARARGWRTVLGQINGGPEEERIVAEATANGPLRASAWQPAPEGYWCDWREECALADIIVVNSSWSRDLAVRQGAPASRIAIVPLAYTAPVLPPQPRAIPPHFTAERPLRLLFLGQVNVRKGVGELLQAVRSLPDAALVLDLVGEIQVEVPERIRSDARICLHGPIARSTVAGFYRNADLFVLPTLSDGFALTQLEALACGLPVLASRRCGEAVQHDVNGYLLTEVTPKAIADALQSVLADPQRLARWSRHACLPAGFSLESIAAQLTRAASPQ